MNGFRFYIDHGSIKDKRKGTFKDNLVNCLVIMTDNHWHDRHIQDTVFECASAVYYKSDSEVCCSAVSKDYLKENCKRISEAKARELHPNLFVYLDNDGKNP